MAALIALGSLLESLDRYRIAQRCARSYAPNAERLIKAKRRYDPDNVIRSTIPLSVTAARAGAHDSLLDAAE
jgi:hypothetical protein